MTRATGVEGVVDPLGEVVDTTAAHHDLLDPFLLQVGCLINEDDVVLAALEVHEVVVVVAVVEFDRRSVRPEEGALLLVVPGDAQRDLRLQHIDMVGSQFRHGSPDDQYFDAWISQAQALGLISYDVALAAASGAAVAHMAYLGSQEHSLLFRRL